MPFTPSHVAAVLPFLRTPLPAAGLVIGSMVPDLPYFVPLGVSRNLTHSLPGVVIADLPMALGALVLWTLVFQAPLRDFAPSWLRLRLPPVRRYRARHTPSTILLVILAVIVGVATHLAWDSFTHPDGWLVLHVPVLRVQLGAFTLYRWAQYASSVVGLVAVFAWMIVWTRRTSVRRAESRESRLNDLARWAAWAVVAGPGVFVGLGTAKGFVEVGKDDLGNAKSECAGYLATYKFGDKCLAPLPCPTELEHVKETIIGLGDSGHRAALAQRRNIAGNRDRA